MEIVLQAIFADKHILFCYTDSTPELCRYKPKHEILWAELRKEKDSHDLLDETIVIIFAELAKFCKTEDECHTKLDRMLYLLKNSGTLSVPPKWTIQEGYTEFLDACEIDAFDEEKRYNYDKDMYDEKRRKGELAAAIEQGVEQGIAIGYDKGHAQGVEEGVAQGLDIVAKNMLAAGLPCEQISQLTGLDLDSIQYLASSMTDTE